MHGRRHEHDANEENMLGGQLHRAEGRGVACARLRQKAKFVHGAPSLSLSANSERDPDTVALATNGSLGSNPGTLFRAQGGAANTSVN